MTKKKKYYTIKVTDSDGNTLMINKVDEREFEMNINYEFEDELRYAGDLVPAEMPKCIGSNFTITGRTNNKGK
jgi:hypothetical protein